MVFIQIIGALWALMGAGNLVYQVIVYADMTTLSLMINFLLFILPGLGLVALARKKK